MDLKLLSILTVVFTGTIAVATVVYVLLTRKLWKATKQSADAATDSAVAARKTAELLIALHRAYVGVSSINHALSDLSGQHWKVTWEVQNFGTLPASRVEITFTALINDRVFCRDPFRPLLELLSAQVLPVERHFSLNAEDREAVLNGKENLFVSLTVEYSIPPSDDRITYRADYSYDRPLNRFQPAGSSSRA